MYYLQKEREVIVLTREEWDKIQEHYEAEVNKIEIPEWPTEAEIKNISSKIDKAYTKAIFDHGRAKVADDNIDRLIDKMTKLNLAGSNESDRKRNATRAAAEYRAPDGKIIDLFELQEETNRRIIFMDSVLRALEGKMKSLTISYGTLKLEASLKN